MVLCFVVCYVHNHYLLWVTAINTSIISNIDTIYGMFSLHVRMFCMTLYYCVGTSLLLCCAVSWEGYMLIPVAILNADAFPWSTMAADPTKKGFEFAKEKQINQYEGFIYFLPSLRIIIVVALFCCFPLVPHGRELRDCIYGGA